MRYRYLSRGTRWVLALATVAYGLAIGVGPILHFSESTTGPIAHVSGLSVEGGGQEGSGSPKWPADSPGDFDCLYCQTFTPPVELSEGQPAVSPPVLARPHAVEPVVCVIASPLPSHRPRAPPRTG